MYVQIPSSIFFFVLGVLFTIGFLFILTCSRISTIRKNNEEEMNEFINNLKQEIDDAEDE